MLIVEFQLLYPVLSSSSINRQNFAKVGKIKQNPSSVDRDGKMRKVTSEKAVEEWAREAR